MKINQPLSALLLLSAFLFAGCSSTETKDDTVAPVGDAGEMDGSGGDSGGATTMGVGTGAAWTGSPLDNPASLTYTKVIYFDFDRSDIRYEYRDIVRAHAEYLAANPSANLTLEGHADERGSREYNIALGELRGETVKQLMIAEGASPAQISVISYGEERPATMGHNEEAWGLNRRVELVY